MKISIFNEDCTKVVKEYEGGLILEEALSYLDKSSYRIIQVSLDATDLLIYDNEEDFFSTAFSRLPAIKSLECSFEKQIKALYEFCNLHWSNRFHNVEVNTDYGLLVLDSDKAVRLYLGVDVEDGKHVVEEHFLNSDFLDYLDNVVTVYLTNNWTGCGYEVSYLKSSRGLTFLVAQDTGYNYLLNLIVDRIPFTIKDIMENLEPGDGIDYSIYEILGTVYFWQVILNSGVCTADSRNLMDYKEIRDYVIEEAPGADLDFEKLDKLYNISQEELKELVENKEFSENSLEDPSLSGKLSTEQLVELLLLASDVDLDD